MVIPYQLNSTNIVALLPDGRVQFLHPSAEPLLASGESVASFDEYILDAPLLDLNRFHLSAPAIAFIEITNRCNLLCEHCYAWSGKKRDNEISTERICGLLDEFAEAGVLQVFLTGGEVFTHPDAVKIVRHARSKAFSTQIFTNGLLLDEETLASIPPANPSL